MRDHTDDSQLRAQCARVDESLTLLRSRLDPESWAQLERAMALTVALYRGGLDRAIDHARSAGARMPVLADLADRDPLLGALLRLHGIEVDRERDLALCS
jgi:hypothetical protein